MKDFLHCLIFALGIVLFCVVCRICGVEVDE